jgi:hypothetical protein
MVGQKKKNYHNFHLFFPVCKRKEFELFQLLTIFNILLKTIQLHSTQGDLTQIFPIFPNSIVNLNFYMKMDPGPTWVSNDR